MIAMPTAASVSEAWVLGLERVVAESGGRLVHLVSTVTEPSTEIAAVRRVLDAALGAKGSQSVGTVAETIFPSSLYPDPGFDWMPGIARDKEAELDAAADALYTSYCGMMPLLSTADGNARGTYFGRMVSWPGKAAGGTNQLGDRIVWLRREHRAGRRRNNTLDMDIAADSEDPLRGVQTYAATDRRTRGFPCLTHVDLTLHDGRLHCLAVYRHQYFIEKAYGNMLGLSALLQFLCQQSGYALGELVVHATMADAQRRDFPGVIKLAQDARAALEETTRADHRSES
jgi:hypothetical protein